MLPQDFLDQKVCICEIREKNQNLHKWRLISFLWKKIAEMIYEMSLYEV